MSCCGASSCAREATSQVSRVFQSFREPTHQIGEQADRLRVGSLRFGVVAEHPQNVADSKVSLAGLLLNYRIGCLFAEKTLVKGQGVLQ